MKLGPICFTKKKKIQFWERGKGRNLEKKETGKISYTNLLSHAASLHLLSSFVSFFLLANPLFVFLFIFLCFAVPFLLLCILPFFFFFCCIFSSFFFFFLYAEDSLNYRKVEETVPIFFFPSTNQLMGSLSWAVPSFTFSSSLISVTLQLLFLYHRQWLKRDVRFV